MRLYLRYSGPGTSIDFGEELPVLGSFGNPRGSNEGKTGFGHLNGRPSPKAAAEDAKKRELRPDQLIDRDWSELPYIMANVEEAPLFAGATPTDIEMGKLMSAVWASFARTGE